jgi:hypothetical protein
MSVNNAPTESRKEPYEVTCRRCGAMPRLMHEILNPRTGSTLRMYRCECGEQMWLDQPE